MYRDEFKLRYKTIPFAICREYYNFRNHTIIAHQHKELELISFNEGSADFYIDTTHYEVKKGDVVIIPPYAIHRIKIPSNALVEYDCICFDLDLIWDEEIKEGLMSNALLVKSHLKAENTYAKRMQEWIGWSCNAYEDEHPGWELKIIGWMSLLIGCLKEQGLFTSNIKGKDEMRFAQRVMSYIINNYSSHITSTDAARNLYMNNSYFCRAFKKSFGCAFSEYVLAYRLEKAKMLIRNTNDPIIEISLKTGFNSCSYFSKAYKAYFGLSPLTYRKEQPPLNSR